MFLNVEEKIYCAGLIFRIILELLKFKYILFEFIK